MATTRLYAPRPYDSIDFGIATVAPILATGTDVDNTKVAAVQAAAVAGGYGTLATSAGGTAPTPFAAPMRDRGPWQANTSYSYGDVVTQAGVLYVAPSSFTSGGSFVAGNWTKLGTYDATDPSLAGTYGALASGNTWTGRQLFNAAGNDGSTGNGFDYTGTVADATPSGGYFNRASSAVTFTGGTNGARGDSVASDAANGTGATFFAGEFIGMEAGGGFVGKGSTQGFYFRGILGANGASAYGELGGFLSDVTSNRPGGLLEGMEVKTTDNVGSRTAAYVGVVNQNNLTVPYWARGLWLTSAGTHLAGDAVYVDGAAGWSSFARFKNSGGTTVFAMDATGKQFIGTHGVTLYDDGSGNLKTDNVLIAPDFFTTGDVTANDFLYQADSTRKILWGAGAPAVAASVGSLFLRTDGGAATTLYVKESGTGTTGWVAK